MSKSKAAVKVSKGQNNKHWAEKMLGPLDEWDREFDSMFRRNWRHPFRGGLDLWRNDANFEGKIPSVDLIDQDDKVLIKAELPGVDKKDVEISVTDETVSIKGKSSYDKEEEKGDYYRREIARGSYERVLAIPVNVDATKAKAKFQDGMLEISLPKTEKSNRKKIAVE